LLATAATTDSVDPQAWLLILGETGLIEYSAAFFAPVYEVGLLAMTVDLIVWITHVVDNASCALICCVDVVMATSCLVHSSCQATSDEFVLP